jgi:formylglycine-generating enzyme required for sulfatase activity
VAGRFSSVVALVLAVGSAAAEFPQTLAWRLKEKEHFYAEYTFLQLVKTHMNELQADTMEDARVISRFSVLEKKSDGSVVLDMEVQSCRYRAAGKPVPVLPTKLEGSVLRVTLDKDLALLRVDGLDDLLSRLAGPDGPEIKPLRDSLENLVRYWVEAIFWPLPGRVMADHEKWQHTREVPVLGMGTEKRKRTFTLAGEEMMDGCRLVKVPFTTVSQYVYDGPEDPGILNRKPRPEIKTQEQGGVFYYDPARGRLASARTQDLIMAEGSGRLRGEDVDVSIELQTATTLRLTDQDPQAAVTRKPPVPEHGGTEAQEVSGPRPRKLTNTQGMKLVLIPAGRFTMGAPAGQAGRTPWEEEHEVEISHPFYMAAHEVTIGQYRRFVEATGYRTEAEKNGKGSFGYDADTKKLELKPRYTWKRPGWEVTDDHPVVNLSWHDCKAYCDWLAKKEGKAYRLPTEAEWEYACRAGTKTRYHSGDDPETLVKVANVTDASAKKLFPQWQTLQGDDGHAFTAPVGSYQPNVWGLYDMHGNALEWCQDWFWHIDGECARDPKGPPFGLLKVQRGGSWADFPYQSTASRRTGFAPDAYCISSGFRVVLPVDDR